MLAKPLPEQDRLLALFDYSIITGRFRWRLSGQIAGWSHGAGYRCVEVDGEKFLVHRLIWKMITGDDAPFIDHENEQTADNRWLNLRDCTKSQNQGNRGARRDNSAGFKNIHWVAERRRWCVQIKHGDIRFMRRCKTLAGAIAIRRLKTAEMFGPFARVA